MKLKEKNMTKKILLFIFSTAFLSCTNTTYNDIVAEKPNLVLKWNKIYEEDNIQKAKIGLEWTFSYMGASLPLNNSGIIVENNLIEIDLEKLGFNTHAIEKLEELNEIIFTSEEYQVNNNIDLGRYISLLLGASEHYYKITGVPYLLSDMLDNYNLNSERGYVNNSGVSFEHRLISFSDQEGFNQLFFCEEVDPETGNTLEFETVELMQNGQPRFGIYDKDGFRINSTDPLHSNAGKPAKCMWCHESGIQPLFAIQDDFEGFIPYLEFKDLLTNFKDSHKSLQNTLVNGVDYQETQQHTLTELIYISFMEPSAERLSLEWEMSVSEVENLLSGLPTHIHEEFFYLGDLYDREDVEPFAPFSGLQVSSSVREESEVEVNYLN
jgi:hypothetical protein